MLKYILVFKCQINQYEYEENDEHDVEEEENPPHGFSLAFRMTHDGVDQIQMGLRPAWICRKKTATVFIEVLIIGTY